MYFKLLIVILRVCSVFTKRNASVNAVFFVVIVVVDVFDVASFKEYKDDKEQKF